MQRIPEPELMSDELQAVAYANADFEEPHNHCIELLKQTVGAGLPETGNALDLGCGAADISIRFAKVFPGLQVDAIDGSAAMLLEAKKAVDDASLSEQINLVQANLQDMTLAEKRYDMIICNAMLHHLHDPMVLWNLIKTATGHPAVFIMDLMRPESSEQVTRFVEEYAEGEPEILKRDFGNSLKAAFTPGEVETQLEQAGLTNLKVAVVSDRHLIVHGHAK